MDGKRGKVESVMAAYARRQHGNVTRRQLVEAGFSDEVIDHRRRIGALHDAFAGVYLVGHRAEPRFARQAAAVLACGPLAMVGGRSAAELREIPAPAAAGIELLVVGRHRRSPRGTRVRAIGHIAPAEQGWVQGIPTASPSLTLLDLAASISRPALADAIHSARQRRLVSDRELEATLAAHPNRKGAAALRRLLRSEEMSFAIESRAEAVCLRLMLEHRLKPDRSQASIGPYRVDFLYERERLVVEVDGYRHHGGRRPFDDDRRRISYLLARGYAVFPITWTDLTRDPHGTMARLRAALAAR